MVRPLAAAAWVLFLCLGASEARADCNDPFGKPHEVLDFHLRMKRADWRALVASTVRNFDGLPLDSPACKDEFPKFPAEFRCGTDGPWIKIGVRKKRGTERGAEAPEKPPLKLDFNEDFMGKQPEAMGQRWPAALGALGYRKLTLNNGQSNKPPDGRTLLLPVLLQEFVALRMLKKDVPATPGVAYAKITLHTEDKPQGEHRGIYILIEDIDRTTIRRRFGPMPGRLLKQSKSNCSPDVEFDDGDPNEAKAAFEAWLKKSPSSFGARWPAETEKGLDLDTMLRQEAIREIILNGDDTLAYAGLRSRQGNNWLAFDPRVGLRQYMPWDLDLTFGQQFGLCQPTPLKCAPNTPILRHCATTQSTVGKLTVCEPEIQKRYLRIMCQLTNGPLSSAEILKEWEAAYAAARPIVPLEKDLVWGGRDPSSPTIDKSFGAEYVRLKAWIPERVRSVQQQLTMRGVSCSPGCPANAREACSYSGCKGERRCEANTWTECRPLGACPPVPDGGVDPVAVDAGAAPDPGARDGGASMAGGAGGSSMMGGAGGQAMAGGAGGASMTGGAAGSSMTGGAGGSSMTGGGAIIARRDAGARPPAADEDPDDEGGAASSSRGGCSIAAGPGAGGSAPLLLALGAAVALVRTRRRRG